MRPIAEVSSNVPTSENASKTSTKTKQNSKTTKQNQNNEEQDDNTMLGQRRVGGGMPQVADIPAASATAGV